MSVKVHCNVCDAVIDEYQRAIVKYRSPNKDFTILDLCPAHYPDFEKAITTTQRALVRR